MPRNNAAIGVKRQSHFQVISGKTLERILHEKYESNQ